MITEVQIDTAVGCLVVAESYREMELLEFPRAASNVIRLELTPTVVEAFDEINLIRISFYCLSAFVK